ncbi:MAG: DUF559 domain-containing protein, partial [Actinomycetota bacterium]
MRVIELVAGFFTVQHCLIAFAQARACGMTPRQIRWQVTKGAWIEVLEHVYRLAGTPDTFEQRVMAAVLHAGLDALACRFTAAALWGFQGFKPGPIHVLTKRQMRTKRYRSHRSRKLDVADRATVHGIPVTCPARTLIDLAAYVSTEKLARALDHCLVRGLVSIESLWRHLNRLGTKGRKRTPILRELIIQRWRRGGRAESVSETDLQDLLNARGIAGWRPQVRIYDGERLVARPDVVFESDRLVIEMLSWKFHGGKSKQREDARRQNELERLGYTVLQFFWEDVVFDPEYI